MSVKEEGKTVNLCEDMRPHKHDEKGFNKLTEKFVPKKKKPLGDKPKSKQNFKNSVRQGTWSDD